MFYKLKIVFLFLSITLHLNCQKPFKQELCWALQHPFAALKVKKIRNKADRIYNEATVKTELDSLSSGGKLDAFRHTFYMAVFAQKIKIKKLRKLGIAHEKGNYKQFLKNGTENGERADSLANVMDLNNNELGLKIGSANKKISLDELKQRVIKEIKAGHALIMKRNKENRYVDCNGMVIDPKLYTGKWFVPKCLVPSD